MANTLSITSLASAESINDNMAPDRAAFRKALDLQFLALRADWDFFKARVGIDTELGQELSHTAAMAWADSVAALQALLEMPNVHPDLQIGAQRILDIAPDDIRDATELSDLSFTVSKLATNQKTKDAELSELLFEAFALLEIYRSHAEFVSVRSAA
jgi:hypothetical protein